MQLSEVETALRGHPGVRDASIVAREVSPGEQKLVAYVVPDSNYLDGVLSGTEEERKRLQKWRKTFDLMQFGKEAASSPLAFNIAGWNSSYTRQPIPAEEMRDWVEATVNEIAALRPQEVLEIGCGTGLLLLRIAPHCKRYVGADQSPAALKRLKEQLAQSGDFSRAVTLFERSADNCEGFSPDSFDTVIINSVVQYFPSVAYLIRVLEQILDITKPGGRIFVGDVRSLLLLEMYASSIELFQAPPSMTLGELRERVLRRLRQQEELLLSPSFFLALQRRFPKISRVEIKPKRARFDNEMTRFRFDAILHLGTETTKSVEPHWLDWSHQQLTPESVKATLENQDCETFAIKNIPNARLLKDIAAMKEIADSQLSQTVGDLRGTLRKTAISGVHPHALSETAKALGFSLDLSWMSSQPDGGFDALFTRISRATPASESVIAWPRPATISENFAHHSNTPGQSNLSGKLTQELLEFIKQKLAAERIPLELVLVDAIPPMPADRPIPNALPTPKASLT